MQRKLLTVLFGQSGLGKTSILQAGVVPRLREQGYLQVLVRMAYETDALSPAEQVKQAIARATQGSGQWTQPGVAVADESLWEFLHHRGDQLLGATGKPLLPLLIFDQFEELFTLAQGDAARRERAARFVAELADLVENRVPAPLEARLEDDDSLYERFDFARSDYRVLLSLREDYLAHLETLKAAMPGITQNRMRLAPMSGSQAMAAVLGPGAGLLDEETAAAIVRFVAGGTELSNAQVEPALLSLILRELNEQRLADARERITPDLLAGSHAAILSDFYARSLADQPVGIHRFIEDELLTDSGYRENIAEERVLRQFQAAGAAPNALALLVDRRLLRVEERLDRRRVELTHDVLCDVVRASRDNRREREAREASERALAEQQSQAKAARLALRKARSLAAGASLLALLAVGAGGVAYVFGQRARTAEALAEQSHALTEKTRTEAEGLLSYLLDDLATSLEPVGELAMLGNLSEHVLRYYGALPEQLRGPDTERNQSLAQTVDASALSGRGKFKESLAMLAEAEARLGRLRAAGDRSEAATMALGKVYFVKSNALSDSHEAEQAKAVALQGVELLRQLVADPKASDKARFLLADSLVGLAHRLQFMRDYAGAVRPLNEARELYVALGGGPDGKNRRASSGVAGATSWLVRCYRQLGDFAAMREAGQLGRDRAYWVLKQQAKNQDALAALTILLGEMAVGEVTEYQLDAGLKLRQEQAGIYDRLLTLDPENEVVRANSGYSAGRLGALHAEAGRLGDAARVLQVSRARLTDFGEAIGMAWNLSNTLNQLGEVDRELGNAPALAELIPAHATVVEALRKQTQLSEASQATMACRQAVLASDLQLARRNPQAVAQALDAPLKRLRAAKPGPAIELTRALTCQRQAALRQAEALAAQGRIEAIAAPLADTLAALRAWPNPAREEQENLAELLLWQAWSQAAQGKLAEAQATLAPALERFSEIRKRSTEPQRAMALLAAMRVVQARIDPARRTAHLADARALWAGLSAQMQASRGVREWRDWADHLR